MANTPKVDFVARNAGYYRVFVDGTQVSQHTSERVAGEKAANIALALPAAKVHYDHDYVVDVTGTTVTIGFPPSPAPATTRGFDATELQWGWQMGNVTPSNPPPTGADSYATLPFVEPQMTPPDTTSYTEFTVDSGGGADHTTVQDALNEAAILTTNCVITITAGTTYTETLRPPAKNAGVITVLQSSAQASLVGNVDSTDASNMWKLQCPLSGASSWIQCYLPLARAHDYWVRGCEITIAPDANLRAAPSDIVRIDPQQGGSNQLDADYQDGHYFDQCYGWQTHDGSRRVTRFFGIQGKTFGLYRSFVECFGRGDQQGGQAIAGWAGKGPTRIEENMIAGGGTALLFGGAASAALGQNPEDLTFRKNHCYRPEAWQAQSGVNTKTVTILELKMTVRALIEQNIFENNWSGHQTGKAILFRAARGTNGSIDDEIRCEDITFRWNIIEDSPAWLDCSAHGSDTPANNPCQRLSIHDNLCYDQGRDSTFPQASTYAMILSQAGVKWDISNNTIYNPNSNSLATLTGLGATLLLMKNNVAYRGDFGIKAAGKVDGTASLDDWHSGGPYDFDFNAVLDMNGLQANYPQADNHYQNGDAGVFMNPPLHDFRLTVSPPFGVGSDGNARGCDVATLCGNDARDAGVGTKLEGVRRSVLPNGGGGGPPV